MNTVVVVVSVVTFFDIVAHFMNDNEESWYNFRNGFINKDMRNDWDDMEQYCSDCGTTLNKAMDDCRIAYKYYHKFGDFPNEETLKRLFF